MVPIYRIFIDLDGVLGDWVGAVCKLFGMSYEELRSKWDPADYHVNKGLGVSRSEMYRRIGKAGREFWTNIEPYPWASELFNLCNDKVPTVVLTNSGLNADAAAGKIEWMKKHLKDSRSSGTFDKWLIGKDKDMCANPGCLLIDDKDSNVHDFRNSGGSAILFPQYWNASHLMEEQAFELVKKRISELQFGKQVLHLK